MFSNLFHLYKHVDIYYHCTYVLIFYMCTYTQIKIELYSGVYSVSGQIVSMWGHFYGASGESFKGNSGTWLCWTCLRRSFDRTVDKQETVRKGNDPGLMTQGIKPGFPFSDWSGVLIILATTV